MVALIDAHVVREIEFWRWFLDGNEKIVLELENANFWIHFSVIVMISFVNDRDLMSAAL